MEARGIVAGGGGDQTADRRGWLIWLMTGTGSSLSTTTSTEVVAVATPPLDDSRGPRGHREIEFAIVEVIRVRPPSEPLPGTMVHVPPPLLAPHRQRGARPGRPPIITESASEPSGSPSASMGRSMLAAFRPRGR